jgi:Tfp pilus assembly protein FimT
MIKATKTGLFRKGEEGFTIAELLIILGILATMTLIALPDYIKTTLPKQRLKAAANDVIADLLYTRMRSASANKEYRNLFLVGADSYVIQKGNKSSGSDAWTTEGTTRVFTETSNTHYHQDVSIDSVSINPVVFKPTGIMTPTTIKLTNKQGQEISIYTSIAGRVKTG